MSKSIFEPLPLEIIQKQSLQDSTFIGEYEYIRKLADSVFISKSFSPQYSSLEYSDFFDFYEKGNKEINIERTEDVLESNATIVATGCPFCNTMMTDGVKNFNKEEDIQVLDVAELIAQAAEL